MHARTSSTSTSPHETTPSPRDRRQSERHAIGMPVSMRLLLPGADLRCQATDISLHGMRIEVDRPVPPSELVELHHPSAGAFAGQLAWRTQAALGIAFDPSDDDLEHCLQCLSLLLSPVLSGKGARMSDRRERFRLRAALAARAAGSRRTRTAGHGFRT